MLCYLSGKGHYGIVRLARHVFSGQEVAVKVIDKTKLDQRETDHLLKEVNLEDHMMFQLRMGAHDQDHDMLFARYNA